MITHCLDCGNRLNGRSDKKFCSDYCRNSYHNQRNHMENNYMRRINYVLHKNRRILLHLNPTGKVKIHRSVLLTRGFDFNFITSIYKNKNGMVYYFCYEQGYLPLNPEYFALVIKSDFKKLSETRKN